MSVTQKLTIKQQEAFDKAKDYFESASNNPILTQFHQKIVQDYAFYDGTQQWPPEVIASFAKRKQSVLTINKVRGIVNNLAGTEIQTRFKIVYSSQSGLPEDDRLANALTHLIYAIDENNDASYKASLQFQDALITGIGWSNIYRDPLSGAIEYEHVSPLYIYFDPDNFDSDLRGMDFVARVRWVALSEAETYWPKHKQYFHSNFADKRVLGNESEERALHEYGQFDVHTQPSINRIPVVEVQYKEPAPIFVGIDDNGRYFETFDEQKAIELSTQAEVEERMGVMVMRTLYSDNYLLEHAPLEPRIPNLQDFTYIPCVISRQSDGKPDGILADLKDTQRYYNYARTKAATALNSFHAIVDANVFGARDKEELREELKKSDSVLVKPPGSVIDIRPNQNLAHGQFELLNRCDIEMQQISGLYDDAVGKETNAESGVAIQRRQINSVRNQTYAFDKFRLAKRRIARMKLLLLQFGGDEFIEAAILTPEEKEIVLLNVVREYNGKKVVLNDIRHLPLMINLKEVPDYENSIQEEQALLREMSMNPNAALIMRNATLLKRLGVSDYEKLAKEMQNVEDETRAKEAAAKEEAIHINNHLRQ